MRRKSSERGSGPGRGAVTDWLLEIVVVVAASVIMTLMVAGGGAATERMTAAEPTGREPTPLSWRELP
jgi:hypothetical protein